MAGRRARRLAARRESLFARSISAWVTGGDAFRNFRKVWVSVVGRVIGSDWVGGGRRVRDGNTGVRPSSEEMRQAWQVKPSQVRPSRVKPRQGKTRQKHTRKDKEKKKKNNLNPSQAEPSQAKSGQAKTSKATHPKNPKPQKPSVSFYHAIYGPSQGLQNYQYIMPGILAGARGSNTQMTHCRDRSSQRRRPSGCSAFEAPTGCCLRVCVSRETH